MYFKSLFFLQINIISALILIKIEIWVWFYQILILKGEKYFQYLDCRLVYVAIHFRLCTMITSKSKENHAQCFRNFHS